MSRKNPSSFGGGSGGGSASGSGSQGGERKTLLCEQWEALLVDALDGKLPANEAAAFEAHRETCLACAQLMEEAKRGSEWLHFLETEPEVPVNLVNKILAQTSGVSEPLPALAPVGGAGLPMVVPAGTGWAAGWLPMMERQASQSRWMMTAAMAFFSIAFTLNMTGIKLNGFHLADLKPTTIASSLTRQFYVADAHVMRYYDNLRFFYEVESRVRELRRDADSNPQPEAPPKNTNDGSQNKPAVKHPGGSAQKQVAPDPEAHRMSDPVMAKYEKNATGQQAKWAPINHRIHKELNEDKKCVRAERSLA